MIRVIFDFDYTLFQSGGLLKAVRNLYYDQGVASEIFLETYEASRMGERDWKPEVQLSMLAKRTGANIDACRKGFHEIVKGCGKFLYEDVLVTLEAIYGEYDLYIVSHGEDTFQGAKIKRSGIGKFFKAVKITGDITKVEPLAEILEKEGRGALFVEDNPLALVETKKVFPWLTTVRINRGEGRYTQEPDDSSFNFVIRDLWEFQEIIKSRIKRPFAQ